MAVTVDNGTLTDYSAATDAVAGAEYQLIKLALGAAGAVDTLVDSGQQTMANSIPVALASDQTALRTPNASSATLSNVAGSASNVTLLAANSSRRGAIIFNDSTAALYIKFGSTASTSSFTYKVFPAGTWEMSPGIVYTGIIDGIWDSATGNARVTEL